MKIKPLGPVRPKPWALLEPGQRQLGVRTLNGSSLFRGRRAVEGALDKLKGFVCYVNSGLERLKFTTGATSWTLSTWHNRETRMTHDGSGVSVSSLRGSLDDSADPLADLATFMAWLQDYGVAPGGLSSMSWNLLRASLSTTVQVGVDPEISRPAFFGGRQAIDHPGTFFDYQLIDKVAAYPTAMAARPVALSLHSVSHDTWLDPDVSGLARARVVVPADCPYPPLPVRVGVDTIQFQWGVLEGTWPWVELAHAIELGCEVDVLECWAPSRQMDLFFNWWLMARTGRDLPGAAGKIAKPLANCLWGQFAMLGTEQAEVRWVDDAGQESYYVTLPERRLPHEWVRHIACEIPARVRNDLSRALYETGARAAHIDTDGIVVVAGTPLPRNAGPDHGQWRVKEQMIELEVRAPQFYRFKRPGNPLWHYVASGMNEGQAAETFRRVQRCTTISYLGVPDMCLPDGLSFDVTGNERLYQEARMLRT